MLSFPFNLPRVKITYPKVENKQAASSNKSLRRSNLHLPLPLARQRVRIRVYLRLQEPQKSMEVPVLRRRRIPLSRSRTPHDGSQQRDVFFRL